MFVARISGEEAFAVSASLPGPSWKSPSKTGVPSTDVSRIRHRSPGPSTVPYLFTLHEGVNGARLIKRRMY